MPQFPSRFPTKYVRDDAVHVPVPLFWNDTSTRNGSPAVTWLGTRRPAQEASLKAAEASVGIWAEQTKAMHRRGTNVQIWRLQAIVQGEVQKDW
jgi:hypothetical protein